jgi:hypothetical protein
MSRLFDETHRRKLERRLNLESISVLKFAKWIFFKSIFQIHIFDNKFDL